jgi:hypothetical protein
MSRVAIPAADLRKPVFQAVGAAAGNAGGGKAMLAGYDPRTGMFEYQVDRGDGTSQVVCVHLVLECFAGVPAIAAA